MAGILELDALVMAGGESRRMGCPKELLPFGDTTLIHAVIEILQPLFRRVLVVARDPQCLDLPGVQVLLDNSTQRGPLVGLARGLEASNASWCFAVACDMPFLHPLVIQRMAEKLADCDILAPFVAGRLQPLHAFYSRSCLPIAQHLLDRGITSARALFPHCRVRTMLASDFVDVDPKLLSFTDLDTKKQYLAAQQLLHDHALAMTHP